MINRIAQISLAAVLTLGSACAEPQDSNGPITDAAQTKAAAAAATPPAKAQVVSASAGSNAASAVKMASNSTVKVSSETVVKLQEMFPEASAGDIRPSPIDGLYEMRMGTTVLYVTADGRYMFQGDILDMETRTNLTDQVRQVLEKEVIAQLDDDETLLFSPVNTPVKHTVTVFTDIDCGYCRKLHREMAAYNKAGIAVRYLFYPRAGLGSDSAKKLETVWCSANRQQALTKAKSGQTLARLSCDNPIAKHYDLGRELGLRGTPYIITEDGRKFPGYLPADELARRLANG